MLNPKAKLSTKIFKRDIEKVPTRNGYGEGLVAAGEEDERVVVLCADVTESTRSLYFAKRFPERFIEVGVAEQALATVAAGMANYGKIPFISSFARLFSRKKLGADTNNHSFEQCSRKNRRRSCPAFQLARMEQHIRVWKILP